MRSIVIKDSTFKQCGICKEGDHWVEEMNIDGIAFLYCYKCNTITFNDNIDISLQTKIENIMNKHFNKQNKKHD